MLSDWEASPESVAGDGVSSDLDRVIRQIAQVRRRLDDISRDVQVLQAGDPYALYQKCNKRSAAGGSLLEEMTVSLDEQIAAARQDLAALETEAP